MHTRITDPDCINALRLIAKKNGGLLLAEDVVSCARAKDNPLHRLFTWDDTDAAEKYRLIEARNIINVVVEVIPQTETESRVFVSLTPDRQEDGGGYRSIVAVMSDVEHRAQLLGDAMAEMKRFRDKYKMLKELAEVFEAFDKVKR